MRSSTTPHRLLALLLAAQAAFALPTTTDADAAAAPKLGAVASEMDVCSKIGTALLQAGGNAVDATVGTVICVGVVGMYHSGLGGGGFMLVRDSAGVYEFVDFRETAPAAAFEDMYTNNTQLSISGGLASGVPGELRGLEYVHTKYGKLPWKTVLEPGIAVARDGFVVTEDLVRYMDSVSTTDTTGFLVEDPNWAVDFAPAGHRVRLGETMTRKRYAATLQTIADQGPDAFYTGKIAETTIAALAAQNGTMTMEDLANYTVALRTTRQIKFRGHKITSTSAPSSGAVGLQALKVLGGFEEKLNFGNDSSRNTSTQKLDEAFRYAYGQRTKLGDPLFVANLSDYETAMLSDARTAEIRGRILDDQTFTTEAYDPDGLEVKNTPGTSHVAVADASGMAVSLTTTVNLLFGSKLLVPETGVIMNNEMNDFSIPGSSNAFGYAPSPANYVRPGKRPLSSITPMIVEDCSGRVRLVTGAAGGSRIITSTVQNVLHVLDGRMSVSKALAMPRLHDQLIPAVSTFEYAFDNRTTAWMAQIGHNVSWVAPGQSAAQAVALLPNGTFEAAGEPRQKNSGGFAV